RAEVSRRRPVALACQCVPSSEETVMGTLDSMMATLTVLAERLQEHRSRVRGLAGAQLRFRIAIVGVPQRFQEGVVADYEVEHARNESWIVAASHQPPLW